MSVLGDVVTGVGSSLSVNFFDNFKPAIIALTPVFGLKLAIHVGPTVFKRLCEETFHSQFSPLLMPVPDADKVDSEYEYFNPSQDNYYVECSVCHTDMSDEVMFLAYDDTGIHICNYCSGVEAHFAGINENNKG